MRPRRNETGRMRVSLSALRKPMEGLFMPTERCQICARVNSPPDDVCKHNICSRTGGARDAHQKDDGPPSVLSEDAIFGADLRAPAYPHAIPKKLRVRARDTPETMALGSSNERSDEAK